MTNPDNAVMRAALERISRFGGHPWDGPADTDEDGDLACQAHGITECGQSPQCIAALALGELNGDGNDKETGDGQ